MPALEIEIGKTIVSLEMSELRLLSSPQESGRYVSLRCPHCGQQGTFPPTSGAVWQTEADKYPPNQRASFWFGMRICPNESCQGAVLTITQGERLALSYPFQAIDFDSTSVPPLVASSLQEAIECHAAGCFRAAALMARRTLEEICHERGATGSDLRKRIAALGTIITIPRALVEAMTEIRLLGNDAAHIEAKTYDKLGKDEVEIAIALCKELVKATYQYEDLLGRIRSFQIPRED